MRLVAEGRVEHDVEVGQLRERREDHAAAALLNVSESGSLAPSGRSRPGGGRSRARSTRVCSSVLPPRETASFVRSRCRDVAQLRFRCRVGRVQFGRELSSSDRFLVAIGGGEPAARGRSVPARRACGPLEREPRRAIVGIVPDGVGVFDDRAVVVLRAVRPAVRHASGHCWRRRSRRPGAARARRARATAALQGVLPLLMTSVPRGILNSNVLSASPTFSLKLLKVNVERAALLVGRGKPDDLQGLAIDGQLPASRTRAWRVFGSSRSR